MVKDFGAVATQYAQDVVDGKIVSNKYHRLACQRHLADLKKAESSDFPYVFNPYLTDKTGREYRPAQKVCMFVEKMPHIKGEWASRGELIFLETWQIFFLACSFGWVNRESGLRRFLYVDLLVPRKNAKSTLAAAIGLYMLTADGEYGAEVYNGATSEKQAQEVFGPAKKMAASSPEFCSYYGVVRSAKNLSVTETFSKFEAVTGDPGDGASPHLWIVDEYHEHKTEKMYDTGSSGMGARLQPMVLMITTAGSDLSGPCHAHQVTLQKILEGTLIDERRFGIIFGIDPEDDWTTEAALIKANPNYGVSVNADILKASLNSAKSDSRKQMTYKTKHLNIWVAARSPWLNMANLLKCIDSTLTLEKFRGRSCRIGLDVGSTTDITSVVYEFDEVIAGKTHYYFISRNYLPEAKVKDPKNTHYQGWVKDGYIIQTPGNMTDLELIQEQILASCEIVHVEELAKDQWNSAQMGSNLEKEGMTVIDVPQTTGYLSPPMKHLQALVDDGRAHFDDNKAFQWMLSNVECYEDANENIFPRKSREENKIDGASATITCHSRAMLGETAGNLDDFLNDPIVG
ncbi:terminase large subunit [Methylophilus sp. Leaf414]|uniref:terminase large subunit n=1 Tax=Methylophilus sp. Leaf414 TaxID=1736371 RepID=UPI0006F846F5|nr:terminase TerL endonuclease subunit [Methylophilus sp. Leaf414]KQT37689.1 hypothetical protein ASG24_01450 [Methylophilus sp. Leaf414]